MSNIKQPQPVVFVRQFTRFYLSHVGALEERRWHMPFTLTEARVLFELGQCDRTGVVVLRDRLRLDAGYLSRVLSRLETQQLVLRDPDPVDSRRQIARLTVQGRKALKELDQRSAEATERMISTLSVPDLQRLVEAMKTIQTVLDPAPSQSFSYLLRSPEPGDLGWVVARCGIAAAAHGFVFPAVETDIAQRIVAYGAGVARETAGAWIAEQDGTPIGSVFCFARSESVAHLELLWVEPAARGHGVGTRLVQECLRWARRHRFSAVEYVTAAEWTPDLFLTRLGFICGTMQPLTRFGQTIIMKTWHYAGESCPSGESGMMANRS